MSIDPEREHIPDELLDKIDQEVLTRPDVLYGLAFDVYVQFRDLTGDTYWRTPPTTIQFEDENETSTEGPVSLGEPKKGARHPISLYSLDSSGEVVEAVFAFQRPDSDHAQYHVFDETGISLEDMQTRQRARDHLLLLRNKLLAATMAPLETFEATDHLGEHKNEDNIDGLTIAVRVDGGPPLYKGVDFVQEYDLSQSPPVDVIKSAVASFTVLNGRRPEWGAELFLKRLGHEYEIPREVWEPHYNAVARAGNVERDTIIRAINHQ